MSRVGIQQMRSLLHEMTVERAKLSLRGQAISSTSERGISLCELARSGVRRSLTLGQDGGITRSVC